MFRKNIINQGDFKERENENVKYKRPNLLGQAYNYIIYKHLFADTCSLYENFCYSSRKE